MRTFKFWDKEIVLNIWEELTVKELRKIQPILKKNEEGAEVEMVVSIIIALSDDPNIEEVVNSLNLKEFTKLSEAITDLMNTEKKTTKSSPNTIKK